jgi:diguanylate cyclase (GGDEF)-like protein
MADLPSGGRTAKLRRDAADRREQSARARLAAADQRDARAPADDAPAVVRDEVAAARSRAVVQRAGAAMHDGPGTTSAPQRIIRAARDLKRTDRLNAQASAFAEQDRRVAAQDVERAVCERLRALVDRELRADALADAEVDALTGARMRAAGLADLEREVLCCHRTSRSLVVAYAEVVGLKTRHDTAGCGAGDDLLVRVFALLKQHLRSHDLIIRLGGDAFVCVTTGVSLPELRRRFLRIGARLAAAPGAGSIRTGFAALAPGDTTDALIARADRQLFGRSHDDRALRSGPRALPPAGS